MREKRNYDKERMSDDRQLRYTNLKEVLVAILIGACVSFLTTLFDGLADFLRTHSEQIIAGMSSFAYYVAKQYRV